MAIPNIAQGYLNQVRAARDRARENQKQREFQKKQAKEQQIRNFGLGIADSLVSGAIGLGGKAALAAIDDAMFGEDRYYQSLKGPEARQLFLEQQQAPAQTVAPSATQGAIVEALGITPESFNIGKPPVSPESIGVQLGERQMGFDPPASKPKNEPAFTKGLVDPSVTSRITSRISKSIGQAKDVMGMDTGQPVVVDKFPTLPVQSGGLSIRPEFSVMSSPVAERKGPLTPPGARRPISGLAGLDLEPLDVRDSFMSDRDSRLSEQRLAVPDRQSVAEQAALRRPLAKSDDSPPSIETPQLSLDLDSLRLSPELESLAVGLSPEKPATAESIVSEARREKRKLDAAASAPRRARVRQISQQELDGYSLPKRAAYLRALAFQEQQDKADALAKDAEIDKLLVRQINRLKIKAMTAPEKPDMKELRQSRSMAETVRQKNNPTTPSGARFTQGLIAQYGTPVYQTSISSYTNRLEGQQKIDTIRRVLQANGMGELLPLVAQGYDVNVIVPMPKEMFDGYNKALKQKIGTGERMGGGLKTRRTPAGKAIVGSGWNLAKPTSATNAGKNFVLNFNTPIKEVREIINDSVGYVNQEAAAEFQDKMENWLETRQRLDKKGKNATEAELQAFQKLSEDTAEFASKNNRTRLQTDRDIAAGERAKAEQEQENRESLLTAEQEVKNAETLAITALKNNVTKLENARADQQKKILNGIKESGAFTKEAIESVLVVDKDTGVMTVAPESKYPKTANAPRRKASLKSLATSIAERYNAAGARRLKKANEALSNAQKKGFGTKKGQQPATKAILDARKKRDALKRSLPAEPKTPKSDTTSFVAPPAEGRMQRFIDAAPTQYARYIQTLKDDASLSPEAKARRALRAARAMNLNIA